MDFKRDVKVVTNFWNLLPAAICMMPDIAAGVQSQDCWNGTAKGRLVPQQHLLCLMDGPMNLARLFLFKWY